MITTNIRPINTHTLSGNVTTQSQQQIVSGGLDTNIETDPIFRHSPAYEITQQDIDNWNVASGVDMSAYVTHEFLSEQAYLTSVVFPDYSNTYQAKGNYVTQEVLTQQAYLTTETDPVFGASPAASITDTDIANWNAAAGMIDMSAYVTKNELVAQSYITSVTFPDYSNTYQAKGNYLTSETDPVFSASPAAGITAQDITNWNSGSGVDLSSYVTYEFLSSQAYITPAQLYGMSYITINDVVFPDYSNTYQAKGNYLTSETDPVFSASPAAGITAQDITNWNNGAGIDLSSYVSYDYLSAQSYVQAIYQTNSYCTFFDDSLNIIIKPTEDLNGAHFAYSAGIEVNYNNIARADLQTFVQYNGTSYNVSVGFYPSLPNGVSGKCSAELSGTEINLLAPRINLARRAGGPYIQVANNDVDIYSNSLLIWNWTYLTNGTIEYNGYWKDYIASYHYVLDQIAAYVTSQSYITTTTLDSCAYITQSDIVFPDYQNTYQAKGDYVTPTELVSQSYITLNDVTFPDYSNTYQTKGDYVTPTELVSQSYVTKSDLSAQSYVTQSTVVFPDYSNTYQAKGDYVTPTQLAGQSYVTTNDLVSQSYITTSELVSQSYVTATQLVSQSYITPTQLVSQSYITTSELVSQSYATKSYVANYVEDAIHEPVVVWETNGVGLTALETNMSASPAWQLTNLDMTPYKHIKIYSRSNQKSGATASASTTAAMVLEMSLDPRAAGPYGGHYIGSTVSQKPNDSNRLATLTCAVSADKTSFAVLRMTSLYGTAATSNSDVNAYVFKIVGYYDEIGGINTSGDLSDYVSKVELSQQSYITSTSLQNMSYVTTTDLSNCGYVQIRLVTQAQYQDRQDNILYIITDAPPIS